MENQIDLFCLSCGDLLPKYSGYGPRRKYCVKASCNAQSRGKNINFSITKHIRSWTKYEGARSNLRGETHSPWCCQACGSDIPKQIPAYMFIFDQNNLLKICPACHHTAVTEEITDFRSLVKLVRSFRD